MPASPPDLQLLPAGTLYLPPDTARSLPKKTARAFAASAPAGLVSLATHRADEPLPPGLTFWRTLAHDLLSAFCKAPPDAFERGTAPPPPADLDNRARDAPPAPGMEYLTADTLTTHWNNTAAHVLAAADAHPGKLAGWLADLHPNWSLLGRLTFHLAENPHDDRFPFAFLATYTHRLTPDGRLQYLPLGRALKTAAGDDDTDTLRTILAPLRNAAKTTPLVRELLESKHVFQALAWNPDQAYRLLEAVPQLEAAGVDVRVPDWWDARDPARPKVQVELQPQHAGTVGFDAMLGFELAVALGDVKLSPAELDAVLQSDAPLLSIKGRWAHVDREKLQQALDHWRRVQDATAGSGIGFLEAMRLLAGLPGLATPSSPELATAIAPADRWFDVTTSPDLQDALVTTAPASPPAALEATLRPYQRDGFAWLARLAELRIGACLADDMGLGKTVQVIALLAHLHRGEKPADRPSLLVVPASLVANWKAEFEKFAPSLDVLYAHRSQVGRDTLARLADLAPEQDAVVTTYAMLGRLAALTEQRWHTVVLDEAHAIKNPAAAQTQTVKKLNGRHRVALTGTPIENAPSDLWSLFDFLNPGLLGPARRFAETVAHLGRDGSPGFAPLRSLVAPYILRRLKSDPAVIADLPEKIERTVNAALTRGQATLYARAVRHLKKQLAESDGDRFARSGLVLTTLLHLKQLCDHPALTTGSGNFLQKDSGKFQRLAAVAAEVHARGEKMLVFTQFRELTAPLSDHLATTFGSPGLVLHGGTPVAKRARLVDAFQDPLGPRHFVISVKAGGTGLNLTAASHVVHFDRWWNPAVENQATDRAYRIGQTRNVVVHKFLCPGTIEEKIATLLRDKSTLAADLITPTASTEKTLTNLPPDQLLDLLSLDLERALL